MKRQFNVFDALFILALFGKLSGSIPEVSWLDVVTPYLIEAVVVIFSVFNSVYGWDVSVRTSFLRWVASRKYDRVYKQAKKETEEQFRGSNPGSHKDPAKTGK